MPGPRHTSARSGRRRRHTFRPLHRVAALAVLTGCGGAAPAAEPVVRDSAGIAIVENAIDAADRMPRWTVGPSAVVRIGVVDGDPLYQFHRLWAGARLSDGRIVVGDIGSGQIRMFDREGRILAAQGRQGEGPGEYRSPQALWILPGDTVAVFDPRLSRVTLLHGDSLRLARVVRVQHRLANPTFAGTLDAGRRLVIMDRQYEIDGPIKPQHADVWLVPLDGSTPDSVLRIVHGQHGLVPGGEASGRMVGSPIFGALGIVSARDGQLLYGGGEYAVEAYDPDGSLRRIVRWHGPDRGVDPREVRTWIDSMVAGAPPERRADDRRWLEALPVADRKPGHFRVLHATDGRIWVSRWAPYAVDMGLEWWVFEPDGRLVATASMPGETWALEIGTDEVLARALDEMGVEYAVVLPIRRGGGTGRDES